MVAVSNSVLFFCTTVLIGIIILSGVAEKWKPATATPMWLIRSLVIAIAVLSYVPVWQIIALFSEDLGFGLTFNSVMFSFKEGIAYWLTLAVCLFLLALLSGRNPLEAHRKKLIWIGAFALVVVQGWGSHAASLTDWGAFAQTIHLLAVYVWVGPLFVTSWFLVKGEISDAFLRWFHVVSVSCVVVIAGSGIIIMSSIVPEYNNSLMLTYGQALLLKHLLFVPIIVFGLCNGIVRRKVHQQNIVGWLRAESILLLAVFLMSGTLSASTPPHDVSLVLNEAQPSSFFLLFLEQTFHKDLNVLLQWGPVQYLLAAFFFLFAGVIIRLFIKRRNAYFGLLCAFLSIGSGYFAIMTSVHLG